MSGKIFPNARKTSHEGSFSLLDLTAADLRKSAGIGSILDELMASPFPSPNNDEPFIERIARGIAFVTFAYDIDGVTMEIAKYGAALEDLLSKRGFEANIHCIGGQFKEKADLLLRRRWPRLVLDDADGWSKWDGGIWFSRLFHEDLPEGSEQSRELAGEVWRQATILAKRLCAYIDEHRIGLLYCVNVNSNPGNLALALAIVLSSELTGCPVLNNNHDFFWEGGTPASQRRDGDPPGPRDHFFRNFRNRQFVALFERILPWNGRRWIQVNINPLQSRHLIDEGGFSPDSVFTIGTAIAPEFFDDNTENRKRKNRRKMMQILSRGQGAIETVSADLFLENAAEWMANQAPVVCGATSGMSLDLSLPGSLYILQPTRVIGRKQIWRDWELIRALFKFPAFRQVFDDDLQRTLTLHITGPVPIEHQSDLERVIHAYREVLAELPEDCARRLFLAFSAGHQTAPGLASTLAMADIFRNADLVVLPSRTEGRGLPILEAAAAGVPIACSRYEPVRVFEAVVGEHLPEQQRILFHELPEGDFSGELLAELTNELLHPSAFTEIARHNRAAVRQRYSHERLKESLGECLSRLAGGNASEDRFLCTSAS